MNIEEFRRRYPAYDNMSDQDLTLTLWKEYAPRSEFADFARAFGYKERASLVAGKEPSTLDKVKRMLGLEKPSPGLPKAYDTPEGRKYVTTQVPEAIPARMARSVVGDLPNIPGAVARIPREVVGGAQEGLIGRLGAFARWQVETATIGKLARNIMAISTDFDVPGSDVVFEHLIRKYGPKNPIAFYDEKMKERAAAGQKWADWWSEQAQKGWGAPDPDIMQAKWSEMPVSKAVTGGARAAPPWIAAIAMSALTRNPYTGLVFLSALSGSSMYEKQRKAGTNIPLANTLATMNAAWEGVTEKVPFDEIFKPAKGTIKKMLKIGTFESAQEWLQGRGENFLEYFGYGITDEKSVPAAVKEGTEHMMDNWVDDTVVGFMLGMLGGTMSATAYKRTVEQMPKGAESVIIEYRKRVDDRRAKGGPGMDGEIMSITTEGMLALDKMLEEDILPSKVKAPTVVETPIEKEGVTSQIVPGETAPASPDEETGSIARYKPFKEPGVTWFFTSKRMLNRVMGVGDMLEDAESARLAADIEQRDVNRWINSTVSKLRKYDSIWERTSAFIKGRPSKSVAAMRDLLDRYEDVVPIPDNIAVPKGHLPLKPSDPAKPLLWVPTEAADIFKKVRALTKYMRTRANMVRIKLGKEPIEYVAAYIPHWIDTIAWHAIEKTYPLQHGFVYKMMKGLPKNIANPTQMHRKMVKDLEGYFSKHLDRLLREMTRYDLRDAYILEPHTIVWDELNQLARDGDIPQSVFDEAAKYLQYDILKHKDPLDVKIDNWLRKPTNLVNMVLKPFGRAINSPSWSVFHNMRFLGHLGAIPGRPRLLTRNVAQRFLLLDLYRGVDFVRGQLHNNPNIEHPITGEQVELMNLVEQESWYQASIFKFADIDGKAKGVASIGMAPYRLTHVGKNFISNVNVAAATGYWHWKRMQALSANPSSQFYKSAQMKAVSMLKEEAAAAASKVGKKATTKYTNAYVETHMGDAMKELLYNKDDMMPEIRDAVMLTQWEYFATSLPVFYRGQFKRLIGLYQTWISNYWGVHFREQMTRLLTGQTTRGKYVSKMARLRALKGAGFFIVAGRSLKALYGLKVVEYMFLPKPGFLPPVPALFKGMAKYLIAMGTDDDKLRERQLRNASREIKESLKIWVPYGLAARDLHKLLTGQMSMKEYFFHVERSRQAGRKRPVRPERPSRPQRPG